MSKFDYCGFYGGYDSLAVSKEKHTREEAIEIAKIELESIDKTPYILAVGNAFVRHRAGINEDGEPQVGWWLEYLPHPRSCPCWSFHRYRGAGEKAGGYSYVTVTPDTNLEEGEMRC